MGLLGDPAPALQQHGSGLGLNLMQYDVQLSDLGAHKMGAVHPALWPSSLVAWRLRQRLFVE